MKTTGNTILITGSTSGIGLGLALRLHQAGNKVIVAGRRQALLDEITQAHPGIAAVVLDVGDPDSIAAAHDTVAASHPDLNVLINNAGIMVAENLLEPADLQVAENHVTTNLLGTIRMTYTFLPLLLGKTDAVIMNVSSAMGFVPFPTTPTYSATKAAVHSLSESLRVQLASSDAGVQVIEIVPAGVRTTLLGQEDNEQAMPLDDFLDEIFEMLGHSPEAKELVVEPAKFFRNAQANGTYDSALAMLSQY